MMGGEVIPRPVIIGIVAALALAGAVWLYHRSHKNLPPTRAAAALRARLHTSYGFRCRTEHNDGTIALAGVDYFCEPVRHPEEPGYWIATDAHRLTGVLPSG
jgi:hypothetical protein